MILISSLTDIMPSVITWHLKPPLFTSFLTKKVLNIINDKNTKNLKKLELEALNKSKAAVAVVTLLIADSQMSKES